jgi:hypothetical protein
MLKPSSLEASPRIKVIVVIISYSPTPFPSPPSIDHHQIKARQLRNLHYKKIDD